RYGKLTMGLIGAWFTFALVASALNIYKNGSQRIGIAAAITAVAPILVFSLWIATSQKFREFVLSVNPRRLTLVQSWRIIGFVWLVLASRGILPALFALPAGYGDTFIGITAPFVALKLARPTRRSAFIFWHVLGILDLVMAVGLAATARLISPQG